MTTALLACVTVASAGDLGEPAADAYLACQKEREVAHNDDPVSPLLPLRGGLTRDRIQELETWLGDRALKLHYPVKMVEVFVGKHRRLSRAVEQRGYVSIHLGWCYGQDYFGRVRDGALLLDLQRYAEPEDSWHAWPCTYVGRWSEFNIKRGGKTAEKVLSGRRVTEKHVELSWQSERGQKRSMLSSQSSQSERGQKG